MDQYIKLKLIKSDEILATISVQSTFYGGTGRWHIMGHVSCDHHATQVYFSKWFFCVRILLCCWRCC